LNTDHSPDAETVYRQVESYLALEPVRRNLILTLLDHRVNSAQAPAGSYWWTTQGEFVVGFAMQSPIGFKGLLCASSPEVVESLARSIHRTSSGLPAIAGEARAAARFAGAWTDLSGGSAKPLEGERLYQLDSIQQPATPGSARLATLHDVPTLIDWHIGFCSDVGTEPYPDPFEAIASGVKNQRFWVWEMGNIVAMAAVTKPFAGASRISHVYTPPQERGKGYGAGVTAAATSNALMAGADTCLLYTQLANATSNSIYRRIGYRSVEERLTYELG